MHGFKPTAKHLAKMDGHQFPAHLGFTGSTGQVKSVGPYTRSAPKMKAGGNFIKKAIKHPGALHEKLHVPKGEKIPAKKLAKATHSKNPTLKKEAVLARTMKGFHHAKGGKMHHRYAEGGHVHDDEAEDKKLIHQELKKEHLVKKHGGKIMHKEEGGHVSKRKSEDNSSIGREEPSNELDAEHGGKTPLRPGFRKGGRLHKAGGGTVKAALGGGPFGMRPGLGALSRSTVKTPMLPRIPSTGLRMPGSAAFGSMPLAKRTF
jgi:hypothetical protein